MNAIKWMLFGIAWMLLGIGGVLCWSLDAGILWLPLLLGIIICILGISRKD